MKVCWFDIETTGLNPDKDQILEIGCVIDDLESLGTDAEIPAPKLPHFHCYVMPSDDVISGNPIALSMNAEIIAKIAAEMKRDKNLTAIMTERFFPTQDVVSHLTDWLMEQGAGSASNRPTGRPITIVGAGKNFARFDEKFLSKLPYWERNIRVRHRVLDPVNFFVEPGDKEPPDLKKCLERAGIIADVPHTAVEDATLACIAYRVGVKRMWAATAKAEPKQAAWGAALD